MKESVAVAKEADAKKRVSPIKTDNSIQRLRDEYEGQLGSLRGVIGNITRDGGTLSVESIATQLSSMHTAQRAPALLALQQTHGNRYVQRVVAGIQAKLKVGQQGDIYEQEADRVADAVMRMPEPKVERQAEEEEILQTKGHTGHTPEVDPDLESRINAIRGGGQPIPKPARSFFERHFRYDFSKVRLHTDTRAAESARAINATAFTVGQDIVFDAGQYTPETSKGLRLLAHELTHVVQRSTCEVVYRNETKESQPAQMMEYEVVSGDTLSAIAQRFNTTVPRLMHDNSLQVTTIQPGQRLQVPAVSGCPITVPTSADTQMLTGAIFAEADPRLTDNNEREAIAWSFVNSVRHTEALCTGTICSDLSDRAREQQCHRDTRDLGRTIRDSIRIGSNAFSNSRWRMVMSGISLLPNANLCLLSPASELTALTRAINAATAVQGGTATRRDYIRFNRASDSPPSPRMERADGHGAHTFYRFISTGECG